MRTTTRNDVAKKKPTENSAAGQQVAAELVRPAKEQGLSLTGPDGLLQAVDQDGARDRVGRGDDRAPGYDQHDRTESSAGPGSENRAQRDVEDGADEATGHVENDVPRDRSDTFTPQIMKKRQRRSSGVDEVVLSLHAEGLTTGEISEHLAGIHGASVSRETFFGITGKAVEEKNEWSVRLNEIYAPRRDRARHYVVAPGQQRLRARCDPRIVRAGVRGTGPETRWGTPEEDR